MNAGISTSFALAAVISCGGSGNGDGSGNGSTPTSPTNPSQPASQTAVRIQISPRTDTATGSITEGDTLHLTVAALDSAGAVVALPAPATWASMDTTARVTTTGTVTLLSSGANRIAAYSGKLADTVSFNLHVTPKLQLRISPRADTTQNHTVGDTVQLSASVKDLFLNQDVSGTNPVTWTSLDTSATVSMGGAVIVRNSGTARIVAATGKVADTVTLSLKVTLPSLRIASINGVAITPAGPNAVADSFNVGIEVRNPPDGSVVSTVFFVANTPFGASTITPPTPSNIQPGETRVVTMRNYFAPRGSYDAYPRAATGLPTGGFEVSGPHVPLVVSNKDMTPPQLLSLAPSQDTTWQSGTALKITLNVADLQSGVQGFSVKTTWASPQPAGCIDNQTGSVDASFDILGIPVVLDFPGCLVPVGINTIVITGMDRAGNTASKTLKITGT